MDIRYDRWVCVCVCDAFPGVSCHLHSNVCSSFRLEKKKNSSSFSYKHSNLHTFLWVCYVTSPKTGSHKIQKKKKNLKTLSSTSVAKCRLWHEFNLWKQALDYKPGRRWPYGAFKLCGRFCVCAKRALKSHKKVLLFTMSNVVKLPVLVRPCLKHSTHFDKEREKKQVTTSNHRNQKLKKETG